MVRGPGHAWMAVDHLWNGDPHSIIELARGGMLALASPGFLYSCIPVFRSSVNAAAVYVRIGNLEGKLTGISFKSQAQHDQGFSPCLTGTIQMTLPWQQQHQLPRSR